MAQVLKNDAELPAKKVRRRLVQLLGRMRRAAATTQEPSVGYGPETLPEGDQELLAGVVPVLRVVRTCRGRITTWSTPSAVTAITNVGPAVGAAPRPGLVVMGSARVISGVATRLRPEEGLSLRSGYVEDGEAACGIGAAA